MKSMKSTQENLDSGRGYLGKPSLMNKFHYRVTTPHQIAQNLLNFWNSPMKSDMHLAYPPPLNEIFFIKNFFIKDGFPQLNSMNHFR